MHSQSPLPQLLLPGTELYKYKLHRRIGGGAFGEVWVAEDQAIRHDYAIKILKPGTSIQQGLREAYIGHTLNHDNLVRVHQADVAPLGGHDYVIFAMDYMPKGSVTKLANLRGFIPLQHVITLGRDILRGLEYLHGHGFFHNDVKPDNVLIGPKDQGMLADYGIVGVSHAGSSVSPPRFYKIHAAPEVISMNEISVSTDIFQVGLTLFRMLVGLDVLRKRFDSVGERDYYKAVVGPGIISASDFPPYIPSRVIRILKKATCPVGASRYQSAVDMRRDLEKLNYPGHWTVDDNGAFVGKNGDYGYKFELRERSDDTYDVVAFRRRLPTGRETRYRKHCINGVTKEAAERQIAEFLRDVVEHV